MPSAGLVVLPRCADRAGARARAVVRRWAWVLAAVPGGLLPACDRQPARPAALPPAIVSISRPVERETTEYLQYTGNTAALESVEVRARVRGFLKAIQFEPRARVKKNDLLFQIEPDQYEAKLAQARAEVAANQARLEMAEYEVSRLQKLLAQDAAAVYEHNQAVAKRDEAKAALDGSRAAVAEAQLNVDYTRVTAPVSGRVSRNMVDAGNLIEAGTTLLATVTNDDSVYAYFDVSEADVLRLKAMAFAAGREPRLERPAFPPAFLGLMNEAGYPHQGRIDYFAPTLDKSTGTVEVRACFPNADGAMLPGLFARVRVPIGKPRKTLAVAETALGIDQGQSFLYVVNDSNAVEYRRVRVGLLDQGLRTIEEGIGPNDWVLVSGLQRVRPGATVAPERVAMPASGPAAVATRPYPVR